MARRSDAKSPSLDDAMSCKQCAHFHERTSMQDSDEWGECWRDPPQMVVEAGEDESPVWVPLVRWHFLPYVCASLKARQ